MIDCYNVLHSYIGHGKKAVLHYWRQECTDFFFSQSIFTRFLVTLFCQLPSSSYVGVVFVGCTTCAP